MVFDDGSGSDAGSPEVVADAGGLAPPGGSAAAEHARKRALEEPGGSTQSFRRLLRATAVFTGIALFDLILALLGQSQSLSPGVVLAAGATAIGLFWLFGFVWVHATRLLFRGIFGKFGPEVGAYLGTLPARLVETRREPADVTRSAVILAVAASATVFTLGSIAMIATLVENRHGAVLIAVTAVGLQAAVAAASALAGWLVFRAVQSTLFALRARNRFLFLHSAALLGLISSAAVAGAAVGLYLAWDVVVEVDGVALLLGVGGVTIELLALLFVRWPSRAPRFVRLQPVLGLALVLLGSRSDRAHSLLLQSDAAKHLIHALGLLSDFDRDASPVLPRFADCRPFDSRVNPGAREIPKNGIDENCDGSDDFKVTARKVKASYPLPYEGLPNLVFVTFDALRADHLGFMGYARPTSPNLDRFAAKGVVFERAFSQDSGTAPSFWSLSAGKTPFQTRFQDAKAWPLVPHRSEKLLAELLKKRGYTTEWLMCGGGVSPLKSGFVRTEIVCPGRKKKKPAAERMADAAIKALDRLEGSQPFFLWAHFFDPHKPYQHYPTRSFGDRDIDKYDEAIAYSDFHFQRLYRRLERSGGDRPLFIVVGADHGENFGDHGSSSHARTLYREVTHVPLVVVGPHVRPRRIREPVALNDLYPTFLELAGVPVPGESTMESQVPVLFGDPANAERLVFQENSYSRPQRHVRAVVFGHHHYLMDLTNGVDELYDFEQDPREKNNLHGQGLAVEEHLRTALREFLLTTAPPGVIKAH